MSWLPAPPRSPTPAPASWGAWDTGEGSEAQELAARPAEHLTQVNSCFLQAVVGSEGRMTLFHPLRVVLGVCGAQPRVCLQWLETLTMNTPLCPSHPTVMQDETGQPPARGRGRLNTGGPTPA